MGQERRLATEPCLVASDQLVAAAIAANAERVAPFAGATNLEVVRLALAVDDGGQCH